MDGWGKPSKAKFFIAFLLPSLSGIRLISVADILHLTQTKVTLSALYVYVRCQGEHRRMRVILTSFSFFIAESTTQSQVIKTVFRESGENATFSCSGSARATSLEWICRGCYSSSPSKETKIVHFGPDEPFPDEVDSVLSSPLKILAEQQRHRIKLSRDESGIFPIEYLAGFARRFWWISLLDRRPKGPGKHHSSESARYV